jgi:hypothetical protein
MRLRQVARAWKTSGLIVGTVKFERFAPDAPFGRLAGNELRRQEIIEWE